VTYRNPVINNTKPTLTDSGFYCDIRYDANDAAPDYVGLHPTSGAATTALDWKIYKFTYSGSDVTRIQIAYGAWDNRTGLF